MRTTFSPVASAPPPLLPAAPPVSALTPPPALAPPPAAAGPLSPADREALAHAARQRRAIDRAVGVAAFNGWCTAIAAALSLPFAFFSITGMMATAALAAIAWREFHGRRRLRQLDPAAPRALALNQLVFGGLLVLYAGWSIYSAFATPSPYVQEMAANPELARMLGPIDRLQRVIALAVYGSLIPLSILFQGGTALYYFRRARPLQAYLRDTPAWVLEVQRASV